MLELNKIHHLDCQFGLQQIDEESVDLCVTSPPYKEKDGFDWNKMDDIFTKLLFVMKSNSLLFLNFGHLANHKARPFELVGLLLSAGFQLNETIIWVKNHFSPIQGKKHLNNLTEFIFLFYKDEMPDLDRLSIGVPYKDASNAKRFNNGLNLRCSGNVWNIDYETIQKKSQKLHNDRFPVELPERCIKLSNISKNSLVLDPFSGSGTTALAAKKMGMNYIGFEINEEYCKIAEERLQDDVKV